MQLSPQLNTATLDQLRSIASALKQQLAQVQTAIDNADRGLLGRNAFPSEDAYLDYRRDAAVRQLCPASDASQDCFLSDSHNL